MEIKLSGVVAESVVDGPGIRYTVFVQGCPHNCEGCHNPDTHNFNGGTVNKIEDLFKEFQRNPMLAGVTLSGGEPFSQPKPLAEFAKKVHETRKNVITYTGFTYENLVKMNNCDVDNLLLETDILIDGKFEKDFKNLELKFRGSENQRIIDVKKTREQGKIVLINW